MHALPKLFVDSKIDPSLGISGKAAEWAVRKQKQHRGVSLAAMMVLESKLVH
jgi:hypothetical protein